MQTGMRQGRLARHRVILYFGNRNIGALEGGSPSRNENEFRNFKSPHIRMLYPQLIPHIVAHLTTRGLFISRQSQYPTTTPTLLDPPAGEDPVPDVLSDLPGYLGIPILGETLKPGHLSRRSSAYRPSWYRRSVKRKLQSRPIILLNRTAR